ncbi:MAG: HIRAN domain-containing protein [Myxococcales bacterium]
MDGLICLLFMGGIVAVLTLIAVKIATPSNRVSGYQALNPLGMVEVVGESFYQDALARITGGKRADGHELPVVAGLLAESNNKYDPNAIGVWINGFMVGHLSREDAAVYAPVLHPLSAKGIVGTCPAVIVGGWDRGNGDEGHFGVKLKLAPPAFVLDLEAKPPDPALKDLLRDLREATTPRARRKVLEKAAKAGLRDDSREALLLEASKLEVEAALEKAASLKTPQAKRRVLETALAEIKADEVDDEHQAQQIAWLEQALAELDSAASKQAG